MHDLLERFCRYVQVDTTANENTKDYPSSSGQFELARILAEELRRLGLESVKVSDRAIVTATIPGNAEAPTIAWLAHLDTSPEAPGKNVKPQVVENYDGGKLSLPGNPEAVLEVPAFAGKTLITGDGTTLLGADDKAGVAVIMTAAARLMADPELPRGPIRVVFTCDEEIGRGTDHLDLEELGAVVAYTLDGDGQGVIENETFSADLAEITVRGVNIHPGLAYQRMVNALRVAGDFLSRLPADLSPERTRERQGFVHPYTMSGGVEEVRLKMLLRSFEAVELKEQQKLLRDIAAAVQADHPGSRIDVKVREQYRNMADYLARDPRAVEFAERAFRKCGLEPAFSSIRGGTDGSRLSEMGLPTPNLATGMHNYHSRLEFACLEEMATAVRVLLALAEIWSSEPVPEGAPGSRTQPAAEPPRAPAAGAPGSGT